MLRLIARTSETRSARWVLPVAAMIAALVVVSIAGAAVGAAPWSIAKALLWTPLSSDFGRRESLVSATPFVFTGVAVAVAFRGGFYNIGAEGQMLAGAIGAAWIGPHIGHWPRPLAIAATVAIGLIFGALWILPPAVLKVYRRTDEVVTTLMLNPVALLLVSALLTGPWKDPETGFPESERTATAAEFPRLFADSRIHLGLLVAIAVAGLCWYVINKRTTGIKYRAAGLAPEASRFAGLPVNRLNLAAALSSGAIAGLAGASEVAGVQYRLTQGLSGGAGFTGIVAATLGGLTIIGSVLSAVMLGVVRVGSQSMSRTLGVPSQLGDLFTGVLLLFMASILIFRKYKLGFSPRFPRSEAAKDGAKA